ncbi:MAG: pseudouridine synthase, partial [Chitinophagales bacterium]
FETGVIEKVYYAVVENKPEKNEGLLQHYLFKDSKNKKAIIYKNNRASAVKCELIYKVIGESRLGYLLEIHLLTGKYHQIRAQLSFIGSPIVGDEKYGSLKKYKEDEICLHAYSIEFIHPVENKKMKVVAELPAEWLPSK